MKAILGFGAAAVALAIVLGAGDVSAAARKSATTCEAAAAIKLIGAAAPDDASVKQLTGARTVRRVAPGQSVSLDYRPDRVTLEISKDQIVGTSCG